MDTTQSPVSKDTSASPSFHRETLTRELAEMHQKSLPREADRSLKTEHRGKQENGKRSDDDLATTFHHAARSKGLIDSGFLASQSGSQHKRKFDCLRVLTIGGSVRRDFVHSQARMIRTPLILLELGLFLGITTTFQRETPKFA